MWTNENRSLYDRRTLRYPSDLTYEEWALIEPPPRKPPGDPLAKSWDIAYRIFCEGNYRQTETLDKDDQRSVRLPRRSLPFSSSFLNVSLRPKSTVRDGGPVGSRWMFPYCQAFDCSNLRRASVSLALNPLINFMLAPVNSLAIGECGALWAWILPTMAASI